MRKSLFSLTTIGAVLSAATLVTSVAHAAVPLSDSEMDEIAAGAAILNIRNDVTTTGGTLSRVRVFQKDIIINTDAVTVVVGIGIGFGISNGNVTTYGEATGDWTTSNTNNFNNANSRINVAGSVVTATYIQRNW